VTQVAAVVNWAFRSGWRVRAVGDGACRAPRAAICGADPRAPGSHRVVLVDLTRHLDAVRVNAGPPGHASVTAQAGVTLEALLTRLELLGYGVAACPGPGSLTLGEALATGRPGTAIAARDEIPQAGHAYGSLSNLVLSLTALVWDARQCAYTPRTFERNDPEIKSLLVHHGRVLIVSATLRIGPAQRLRCVSRTDISAATLFTPPGESGSNSFSALVERTGRVESLWFPFTPAPWLRVWSVAPQRPHTSRLIQAPHDYKFPADVVEREAELSRQIAAGDVWATPLLTAASYATVVAGLAATGSADLWGWAKNTQLFARWPASPMASVGYVVLTRRGRIQHVVSAFYEYLNSTLEAYRAESRFPVNGPWEVRVTGLDDPADCGIAGAQEVSLSPVRPPDDRDFDVAVWVTVRSLPGTPDARRFHADLEEWLFATFDGLDAAVRPIRPERSPQLD
jgi:FAD/FMN-containing dehydrogenase